MELLSDENHKIIEPEFHGVMKWWNKRIKDFVKEELSTTFNDENYKICGQELLVTHKL